MEDRNAKEKAPHRPVIPTPPVPNRAETEMHAPSRTEMEIPHQTELDLPGKRRTEMQVGNFKPGFHSADREGALGNFDATGVMPENSMEN